jgi:hypothetical protein
MKFRSYCTNNIRYIDSITVQPECHTPEEVSRMVCESILEVVEDLAHERGQGVVDLEEALTNMFSDVIEVVREDDTVQVRRKHD